MSGVPQAAVIAAVYLATGAAIAAITSVPGVLVTRSTGQHEPMTRLGAVVVILFWPLLVLRWFIP